MCVSLLKTSLLLDIHAFVDIDGKKSHILYINYSCLKSLEEQEERAAWDKFSESSQIEERQEK